VKYNLLLLLCSTFLFSCKKETTEQCFKVKWIDSICAINIYQIQDSVYMYLGEDNYILSKDGKVYDNIFVQSNYCDNIILTSDNTAMVKLNNERDNLSCVICLAAYVNPPSKNLSIKQCR